MQPNELLRKPSRHFTKAGTWRWGHSISRMLEGLSMDLKPDGDLIDEAEELDGHYILTRYLNLHSKVLTGLLH